MLTAGMLKNLGILVLLLASYFRGCAMVGDSPKKDLFKAIWAVNAHDVREHIAAGADLNQRDEHGGTPLHYVITDLYGPDYTIFRMLIDAGAPVNAQDSMGRSPLFYAVYLRYTKLVQELLSAGANVNKQDNDGMAPLHKTVMNDDFALTRMLLKHGAWVDLQNLEGITPLDLAKKKGAEQLIELMQEKSDI